MCADDFVLSLPRAAGLNKIPRKFGSSHIICITYYEKEECCHDY